ncbi:MAG: hypothetical protein AB7U20_14215 [Planctomycetaceae bacterium]
MSERRVITRAWIVDLLPGEVRPRCRFRRRSRRILSFPVQLELRRDETWRPFVRYDNAHGFCHRDTIHADGSQEKTPVFYGDANTTFSDAIDDLQPNWRAYRGRYLKEMNDD